MPAIANLSLQNNAATAVTGTALSPSAGEGVPAIWRVETTKPPFARPLIQLSARKNQKGDVRVVDVKVTVPYSVNNTSTGLEQLVSKITFAGSFIVPQDIPTSVSDDAVAYIKTFFADTGVISALKAQIAPT